MRVLYHGLQAANRSGTGRYTVELMKALATLEGAPQLTCLWPDAIEVPLTNKNVDWVRCRGGFLRRFCREQWGSGHMAKQYGADVVHFPASVAASAGTVPMVVTVHDLCYRTHPEWFSHSRALYYRAFVGRGIHSAARIIADSRATAEDVMRFHRIPESRIDVVPLGVDARFQPAGAEARERVRREYGLPEMYLLFVGTLEPRKNLSRVLEAWTLLGDTIPDLVIAGRVGWKTDLERLVPEEGRMRRKLHCLGHVAQDLLPALYSEATAFVWPSLMEGFGLPPLEAMACGTPVITSNTSSMPEVVGDAAITVDPCDVHALAEAMRSVAEDEGLRLSLRETGRARAAIFTWERTAAMTRAAYERAVLDNGGGV